MSLNTVLDQYFGGSVRTEELGTSSFSTAGYRGVFFIVWFQCLAFFHFQRQVCAFRATNTIQFIKSEKRMVENTDVSKNGMTHLQL